MRLFGLFLTSLLLAGCGNRGGISDADYAEYKELGAPKILYSCTTQGMVDPQAMLDCLKLGESGTDQAIKAEMACVDKISKTADKPVVRTGYTAGVGMNATYNKILGDAKAGCSGEFTILESKS